MGVMPRGTVTLTMEMEYARPVVVNVWNELSFGNVLDYFEKWKKELGCNKVAPIKPEAGAIFFYSYIHLSCHGM